MSMRRSPPEFFFFFFNDTATTEIYTLSLHDALPICHRAYIAGRVAEGGTERAAEVRFAGKAQACGLIRNAQTTAGRVGQRVEGPLQTALLHVAHHSAQWLGEGGEPVGRKAEGAAQDLGGGRGGPGLGG